MSRFVENPTDFSAQCACQGGRCLIARENVVFLKDGNDLGAIDRLQWKCGSVVIASDASSAGRAQLYHTSCQRMTDVVEQIFEDCLGAPVCLPQHPSPELSLGEVWRRQVEIPFDDCRVRVEGFDFQGANGG